MEGCILIALGIGNLMFATKTLGELSIRDSIIGTLIGIFCLSMGIYSVFKGN